MPGVVGGGAIAIRGCEVDPAPGFAARSNDVPAEYGLPVPACALRVPDDLPVGAPDERNPCCRGRELFKKRAPATPRPKLRPRKSAGRR
jgi:hypothetical protein